MSIFGLVYLGCAIYDKPSKMPYVSPLSDEYQQFPSLDRCRDQAGPIPFDEKAAESIEYATLSRLKCIGGQMLAEVLCGRIVLACPQGRTWKLPQDIHVHLDASSLMKQSSLLPNGH